VLQLHEIRGGETSLFLSRPLSLSLSLSLSPPLLLLFLLLPHSKNLLTGETVKFHTGLVRLPGYGPTEGRRSVFACRWNHRARRATMSSRIDEARAARLDDDARMHVTAYTVAYRPRDASIGARGACDDDAFAVKFTLRGTHSKVAFPPSVLLAHTIEATRARRGKPLTSLCPERQLTSDQSPVGSSSRSYDNFNFPGGPRYRGSFDNSRKYTRERIRARQPPIGKDIRR